MKHSDQQLWRRERIRPFIDFLSAAIESPPPRNALLSLSGGLGSAVISAPWISAIEQEEKSDIDATEKRLNTFDQYRWLDRNKHFQQALHLFEKKRTQAKRSFEQTVPRFGVMHSTPIVLHPRARLRFVDAVVKVGYLSVGPKADSKTRRAASPDSEVRRQAQNWIRRYTVIQSRGVHLRSYVDDRELQRLLSKLSEELSSTKRKPYEGAKTANREAVYAAAILVGSSLNVWSKALVERLCDVFEIEVSPKTVERQMRRALLSINRLPTSD